ncbi:MAG: hypothetical protein UW65_C0022G0022 [candidate division WWE3 bacterium GW2011_GWB1_44_4]|uniref:Cytochrome C biogenesis protein transmembrane domain-containing protein n=3 Tax=Katanobacteria TaxID=422282 RepID=A0A0G1KLU6_UNCKA|nr:MAG: hypothetical protein UW36_C0006G0008 [candidate division WWE3 bacterium GW2011_GWA2_44_16]KKT69524.1 MAG: hypothetical protein UW65_C0022G0022 [candidate division WWE3 bacterium GW2011_GWB1_44_4]KKT84508.1 MAG: hypothetical protein UW82_C0019G0009 [candidate division WWE3 bacterium GW2011_GWC2_44_9]
MANLLKSKSIKTVVILGLAALVIGVLVYNYGSNRPIRLPKEIDLKELRLTDKPSFSFSIKNTSDANVEIARIYTSCGCTVVLEPTNSFILGPKNSIQVTMQFDPASMHKNGDDIYHEIYVLTSKPTNREYIVKMKGKIASSQETVEVFYNSACTDCVAYINEMKPMLAKYSTNPVLKDYINKPSYRKELNALNTKYQVPYNVQDSLTFFLKPNLIIEGHVPQATVETLLQNYHQLPKHSLIVLYQPNMHSNATDYQIYLAGYTTKKLAVSDDVLKYINSKEPRVIQNSLPDTLVVPVVVGAITNSLHPCAIAVLLLLLTFLYTIKKSKRTVILIGLSYIFGVFLVYFLIGLGLLRAISLSSEPFFVAKIATVLLLILGLINIKDYFFPKLPIHLKIPDFTKGAIQSFMEKASIPSAFIVGALVGMCAFPCTGGIYTVIISTLAATASSQFVLYLILYNIIFVLPLLVVVLIASNKELLEKVEEMHNKNSRKLHLITGVLMVLIAIGVYFWIRIYM